MAQKRPRGRMKAIVRKENGRMVVPVAERKKAVASHGILSTEWNSSTMAGWISATMVLSKAKRKRPTRNENIIRNHYN